MLQSWLCSKIHERTAATIKVCPDIITASDGITRHFNFFCMQADESLCCRWTNCNYQTVMPYFVTAMRKKHLQFKAIKLYGTLNMSTFQFFLNYSPDSYCIPKNAARFVFSSEGAAANDNSRHAKRGCHFLYV